MFYRLNGRVAHPTNCKTNELLKEQLLAKVCSSFGFAINRLNIFFRRRRNVRAWNVDQRKKHKEIIVNHAINRACSLVENMSARCHKLVDYCQSFRQVQTVGCRDGRDCRQKKTINRHSEDEFSTVERSG
jgi:hypothetical protein